MAVRHHYHLGHIVAAALQAAQLVIIIIIVIIIVIVIVVVELQSNASWIARIITALKVVETTRRSSHNHGHHYHNHTISSIITVKVIDVAFLPGAYYLGKCRS